MPKTMLIIKPDAYKRDLEEDILRRVRDAGLKIVETDHRRLTRPEVEELYVEHREKPFFRINTEFILSGPVGLFLIEDGGDAADKLRAMVGNKDPELVREGTIRGDFGVDREHIERNLVHASANMREAERECELFFPQGRDAAARN
jgi:nucleoside-diphosphate kinase